MLSEQKVKQVQSLLREARRRGVRVVYRRIAIQTGVSREMVTAIAKGTRKVHEKSTTPPARGLIERCPHCGAMVEMPCLLCTLESKRK